MILEGLECVVCVREIGEVVVCRIGSFDVMFCLAYIFNVMIVFGVVCFLVFIGIYIGFLLVGVSVFVF